MKLEASRRGNTCLTFGVLYDVVELHFCSKKVSPDYRFFDGNSKSMMSVCIINDKGSKDWFCGSNFKVGKAYRRIQKLKHVTQK